MDKLVFARGYHDDRDNGTFVVQSDLSDKAIEANPRLELIGVRAAVGDLTLTVARSLATLISYGDIKDWEAIGMVKNQNIYIGGLIPDSQFVTGHDFARVMGFLGHALLLDKVTGTRLNTDKGVGRAIDVLFGRYYAARKLA